MSKFKLRCDNEGTINTLEFECETLTDILTYTETFLQGCGYAVDWGTLTIMKQEDYECKTCSEMNLFKDDTYDQCAGTIPKEANRT